MPQINRSPTVTASEIGEFVYCAKAWYLKRCGETAESEYLEEGVSFHEKHGAAVSRAEHLNRAGKSLAAIAVLLLVALLLFWYVVGEAG
ncbi:MAG: hypothetical protein MOB07_00315 [Acidobacteria bacterium]|nr:hypothetical protein [Acidobacteriota bacterium]